MKLQSISISNILSFKYEADLARCQTIEFDDGLNILVGPNGSGKSNLLEIINYLFHRVLFKLCQYEEERLDQFVSDTDYPQFIKHTLKLDQVHQNYVLAANDQTSTLPSVVKMNLSFNKDDGENMLFVYKNIPTINAFITKYSNLPLQFKQDFDPNFIYELRDIELKFERNNDITFRWPSAPFFPAKTFLYQYLEYFEVLQAIVLVANKMENVDWPLLKNTLALIGCYRNYESYNGGIKAEGNEQTALRQTIKGVREHSARSLFSGEPAVFDLVKKKIAYHYAQLKDEKGKAWADEQIYNFPLFRDIRDIIRLSPLHLDMKVDRKSPTTLEYEVQFVHQTTDKPAFIDTMSGGQKSMLHLVFSLFGFENPNGLILIDEPELHLHLQTQQQYLNILGQVSETMQIQFIVVTHSSAFIQPSHIYYIYRFHLRNGFTRIVHPEITETDRQLLQIITLTNATKIFFGEKIVLVEGETDEYFYRHIVSELVREGKVEHGTEIINIQGKGNYSLWKAFLEKFAMPCYFLGDWDNVVEFGLLKQADLIRYADEARVLSALDKNIQKKDSRDRLTLAQLIADVCADPSSENLKKLQNLGNYLITRYISSKDLLKYLRNNYPTVLSNLHDEIAKLKAGNVFLLAEGELEDYLPVHKGMDAMVEFVKTGFSDWKKTHTTEYDILCGPLFQIAGPIPS